MGLPGSTFLGIDGSQRQVAEGQQMIQKLELKNIELRHQNLLEFTGEPRSFDYIICHGVYSWVPPPVQEKILEISGRRPQRHRLREEEKFETPEGVSLNTHDPLVKAAMVYLAEFYPKTVPFDTLRDNVCEQLHKSPETVVAETENLGKFLLTAYARASTSMIELHLHAPQFSLEVGERPIASPLARLQAEKGNVATNLRHEVVGLPDFNRHLLRHLDGKHDRKALVEVLMELIANGELRAELNGKPVQDQEKIKALTESTLDAQLPQIARQALPIG